MGMVRHGRQGSVQLLNHTTMQTIVEFLTYKKPPSAG